MIIRTLATAVQLLEFVLFDGSRRFARLSDDLINTKAPRGQAE